MTAEFFASKGGEGKKETERKRKGREKRNCTLEEKKTM